MALTENVSGEASVWIDTNDSGGLLELGICVDSVKIRRTFLRKPIHIDTYGSEMEFDSMNAGVEEIIDMELIYFDLVQLARLQSKCVWNNATLGTLGAIGNFMIQSGMFTRLLIKSPVLSQPYNYPHAILIDADEFNLGNVEALTHKLTFKAYPSQQTGSTSGAVLYNTANS